MHNWTERHKIINNQYFQLIKLVFIWAHGVGPKPAKVTVCQSRLNSDFYVINSHSHYQLKSQVYLSSVTLKVLTIHLHLTAIFNFSLQQTIFTIVPNRLFLILRPYHIKRFLSIISINKLFPVVSNLTKHIPLSAAWWCGR